MFDPETSYHDDWEYVDRVKDATWERADGQTVAGLKARWGSINTPDLMSTAVGLGLSSDAAAIVVWQPKPTDTDVGVWVPNLRPRAGDVVRRTDTRQGWSVKDVTQLQTKGKWLALADVEVVNG